LDRQVGGFLTFENAASEAIGVCDVAGLAQALQKRGSYWRVKQLPLRCEGIRSPHRWLLRALEVHPGLRYVFATLQCSQTPRLAFPADP